MMSRPDRIVRVAVAIAAATLLFPVGSAIATEPESTSSTSSTTTPTPTPTTTTTIPSSKVVASRPAKPSRPTAVVGDRSATLTWSSPPDGGSPLVGFIVRIWRHTALIKETTLGVVTTRTFTGLRAGSSHTFAVAAVNAVGVGAFSARSLVATPLKVIGTYTRPIPNQSSLSEMVVADAPSNVLAFRMRNGVIATWTPPFNAAVRTFEVWITQSRSTVARVATTATGGAQIWGLRPGRYSLRVVALNAAGQSATSKSKVFTIAK